VQTYRIVTPCFSIAQNATCLAISTRDDDDESTREIVAVADFSASHEGVGRRVASRPEMPLEVLSSKKWVRTGRMRNRAEPLIAAMREVIDRVHARGLPIIVRDAVSLARPDSAGWTFSMEEQPLTVKDDPDASLV
jgi:hypothetical protein